jgi:hypothetical protein
MKNKCNDEVAEHIVRGCYQFKDCMSKRRYQLGPRDVEQIMYIIKVTTNALQLQITASLAPMSMAITPLKGCTYFQDFGHPLGH